MVSKQNTHNQIYEEVNTQESCQISDKTGNWNWEFGRVDD
jgi:hypothetical protein